MPENKHKDYQVEVERLEYTKDYINKVLDATAEYKSEYKADIREAMKELDFLDSSQSYIRVLINSKFIDQANENYENLLKVKDKPYFARVDFKSAGKQNPEQLYIGKTSLYEIEAEQPLIIDWRAPIASIYYEGRIGEVSYQTETGVEKGEMLLKRQFTIEDGELKDIFDIDITTNDAFLQASLDVNADNRLKDIASTIQGEQNRVIRAKIDQPLIVQGVAGSGKTTIALHRIAYLIYTYEDSFDPDNFMIITPNKLFIDYISDVLPELGVENVRQSTFIDFMEELIGEKHELIDPDQKITKLIASDDLTDQEKELIAWSAAFKGSLEFKEMIDSYLVDLGKRYLPRMDFRLDNHILFSYWELNEIFLEQLKHLPFEKRKAQLKKSLSNRLRWRKEKILKEIEDNYNGKINAICSSMEESEDRRFILIKLMDERDTKLEEVEKKSKTLVKDYFQAFKKISLFDHYTKLLNKITLLKYATVEISKEKLEYLSKYSQELLKKKEVELEDYAPLAYLKHKIWGFDQDIKVNNVVMDEAQDYSLFQFYVLKEILNTNMFTILGDIAQGIHAYRGTNDWNKVMEDVFAKEEISYRTLEQSYRTTIEVMDFANQVIKNINAPNLVLAKPVIRRGQKPQLRNYNQVSNLTKDLTSKIAKLKEEYQSIALICKTTKECQQLKESLAKLGNLKVKLIDNKDDSYAGGVVIVPSYLAKGLEFDVVVIVNLAESYTENELDLKLLYVAMTRSLHRLYIYQQTGAISVLDKIDNDFYETLN
ncbi:hypothetical protein U472_00505 [Orenia metallireducens]|uniref:DNA 3'-5' helicase n=1 Tax=Orenia metallireducens TaxID=1413210 RepID=A0A1C0AD67_9FIRM|nr:RNA polymerase recycling motor HelD [Orenia metallireducens]OCL28583.1 hypothetical protein U472_00505 [Orenia metallireducens]